MPERCVIACDEPPTDECYSFSPCSLDGCTLLMCSGCQRVHYCSKSCQRVHYCWHQRVEWKAGHKHECKKCVHYCQRVQWKAGHKHECIK